MKKTISILTVLFIISALASNVFAVQHTVVKGDTMWKLSRAYGVKLQDVINSNPQIEDPDLIYPGQVLNIPVEGSYQLGEYENEVIRLVNAERAKNGLRSLAADTELSYVAHLKSSDMHDKKYFSHTSPTYGSPFQMMKDFGISYRSAGENIAMGQRTPSQVVTAWMNSPGHRANILNGSYTHIGVGFVSEGYYWTQMFRG